MPERKQNNKRTEEKKSKKEPKLRVRDLKASKDARGGDTPPTDWKDRWNP
jgi:hypothetical protein